MTEDNTRVAGVDISKAFLDLAFHPCGEVVRVTNDAAGLRELLCRVRKAKATKVVFEPTGRFHFALEAALDRAGIPGVKVNPRRARQFAEAAGGLAKTDRADARALARMGAALDLAPTPLASPARLRLRALLAARSGLIADRTATINRLAGEADGLCRRLAGQRLLLLKRQIAALDQEVDAVIAADPDLADACRRLSTIPGVGPQCAAMLIAEMPELGTMAGRQAASLAGLAPVARDSGARQGRRIIRGGRATLRRTLYMPALVASRWNPALRAVYERLIAAGKPAKVALTALMRKLIILANAMLRDGRDWATDAP
ncbi:transposase [Acuticoccus kandeliae]|uniref:transposase n=1 Tax=Acuticoccus kandeliae TaxID=2073160 RepID=UPI000D3EA140|nr:transposase [Acuticoccus kandeliae]